MTKRTYHRGQRWASWPVEMETAALYMNAARAGKKALTLLTVSDNIVTGEMLTSEERERSFVNMIHLALSLV